MYLNICEKSLTSVFIFCFKENWEKVPFLKVLDKETPLRGFSSYFEFGALDLRQFARSNLIDKFVFINKELSKLMLAMSLTCQTESVFFF